MSVEFLTLERKLEYDFAANMNYRPSYYAWQTIYFFDGKTKFIKSNETYDMITKLNDGETVGTKINPTFVDSVNAQLTEWDTDLYEELKEELEEKDPENAEAKIQENLSK